MPKNKISIKQMQAVLILSILSARAVTVPKTAASFAGQDGWLAVLGATGAALIYVWLINKTAEMFPYSSYFEYSKTIAGNFIGFILSGALSMWILIQAAAELRAFAEIIKQWLLFKTPVYVTCAVMAVICAYAAASGIEAKANVAEALIYIAFVPFAVFLVFAAVAADFRELAPVAATQPKNIFKGAAYMSASFWPVAYAAFLYPVTQRADGKMRGMKKGQYVAVLFSGVLLSAITAVTCSKFGANYAAELSWPALKLLDTIKTPGNVFERLDSFVLGFWMISSFIAISAGLFFSSHTVNDIFFKKDGKIYLLLCTAFVFTWAVLPINMAKMERFISMCAGAAFLAVIPAALLIIAKTRKFTAEGKHD